MKCLFTVCMSVYKNDKPEFVRVAFDSMLVEQSIKPSEILLVRDGKVSEELEDLLCKYETQFPNIFRIIRLKQNEGLGKALELGVRFAKNEIVARMDSDDICLSKRFEKQLIYLEQHPECDIVGGTISEFIK